MKTQQIQHESVKKERTYRTRIICEQNAHNTRLMRHQSNTDTTRKRHENNSSITRQLSNRFAACGRSLFGACGPSKPFGSGCSYSYARGDRDQIVLVGVRQPTLSESYALVISKRSRESPCWVATPHQHLAIGQHKRSRSDRAWYAGGAWRAPALGDGGAHGRSLDRCACSN